MVSLGYSMINGDCSLEVMVNKHSGVVRTLVANILNSIYSRSPRSPPETFIPQTVNATLHRLFRLLYILTFVLPPRFTSNISQCPDVNGQLVYRYMI